MAKSTAIDKNLELKTPVQQFYTGQNILITGGTGFLGKVLIEKLLRSCPGVTSIYIIVRAKNGQDVNQRIDSFVNDMVFDIVRKESPKFRRKIIGITGDCSLPGLGLSASDRELIKRKVSIVFNVAAIVNFTEKLRVAVNVNIIGTIELLELCKEIQNLKSVIHISTAYSNCTKQTIGETFYEPPMTGKNIIKLVESLDDKKLEIITPSIIDDFPNTYTFTKCIAENVVRQYGGLPSGIFRPAIVISTYREPVVGWIDNIYGPTGAVIAGALGLLRTLQIHENYTVELIPADYTINALIATAWDVANNKNTDEEPLIYNYHSSWTDCITWRKFLRLTVKYANKKPSIRSIWSYNITFTKYYYLYYILKFILHVVPAFLLDFILHMMGRKKRMLQMYKKIHKYSEAVSYFILNKWHFRNDNILNLWNKMSVEDKQIFHFSLENFDWEDYLEKYYGGIRLYLLKEDESNVPQARKRMARIILVHKFIKCIFIYIFVWILYCATSCW